MTDSIEFTQLMADASDPGANLRRAESLRSEFIASDPDDIAATADATGKQVPITSGGTPMTVAQVQAELQVLILGE